MYNTPEFTAAWDEWKTHKKEKHGMPYTSTSEDKAIARLFKESHGIEGLAIFAIEEATANNWAKVYVSESIVSKYKNNGKEPDQAGQQSSLRESVKSKFNERFAGR